MNPFKAEDVQKIEKQVKAMLQKKIATSTLKSNAENRLLTELSHLIFATRAVGWTLEYHNVPIQTADELKMIKP